MAERMQTRPKNATQRPGLLLLEAQAQQNPVKRRTKAEKAADDQREKEAKEAKEAAVQDSYKRIAVLQEQMQAAQQSAHADAPKARRPRTRQAKAVDGDTVAENTTAKGGRKGRQDQSKGRPAADVAQPASDDEVEMPASPKLKVKKALKTAVRDAIEAVTNVVDGISSKPRDSDRNSDAPAPAHLKFQLAGRINGWGAGIPASGVKASSKNARSSTSTSSSIPPSTSSSASSATSVLSRGSTISTCPPPPTPLNSPTVNSDFVVSGLSGPFDDDTDEAMEREAAIIRAWKGKEVSVTVDNGLVGLMDEEVTVDGVDQFPKVEDNNIVMSSDIEADDVDLTPPPSTQLPRSSAVSLKRKRTDPIDSDSEVEITENVDDFKAVVDAGPLPRRVTTSTDVSVAMKAPTAKRLKVNLSTIANNGSNSSINTDASAASQEDAETDADRQDLALSLLHRYESLQAKGAISLATAAMERALKLFADGDILLGDIDVNSKGKLAKTPHKHNKSTGKESSALLAFSEANWGSATRAYMKSINRHGEELISAVSELARNITLKRCGVSTRNAPVIEDDSADERAFI
ncbi:hypothetical protein BV22DRAFT_1013272 [Leucogyrophana mollusca]|uniref:Uncharacterized protein n=1 Tax=Leucogyrophana mollusca TaxID=85980 RepID=A0ACB8BFA9_9AGAM|nr:hypothetical protein BV22DRAFT_1013272 [Leucogyrophana mollusca]